MRRILLSQVALNPALPAAEQALVSSRHRATGKRIRHCMVGSCGAEGPRRWGGVIPVWGVRQNRYYAKCVGSITGSERRGVLGET